MSKLGPDHEYSPPPPLSGAINTERESFAIAHTLALSDWLPIPGTKTLRLWR